MTHIREEKIIERSFPVRNGQLNVRILPGLLDVHKQIGPSDVLMINCWANSLYEVIDGFDPKWVLTSHENELGHTIDHRESYWTSYDKLSKVSRPHCLMTWGEGISYHAAQGGGSLLRH